MYLPLESKKIGQYLLQNEKTHLLSESAESIISDTRGDIKRVLTAVGEIDLSDKHISGDRCMLSGKVQATVLYYPEEGGAIESVEVSIPLDYTVPLKGGADGHSELLCYPMLTGLNAVAVNPRKVRVSAEVALTTEEYVASELEIAYNVVADDDCDLQVKSEDITMKNIVSVQSKSFTVNDEATPETPAEPIERILLSTSYPVITDHKMINSKLVVKGHVESTVLYTAQSAPERLLESRFTVPFSHIMEAEAGGEDSMAHVNAFLRSSSVTVAGSAIEQGDFSVGYTIELQVIVHEQVSIAPIVDVYGIQCFIEDKTAQFAYGCVLDAERAAESFAETLTPEQAPLDVLQAFLFPVSVAVADNGRLVFKVKSTVIFLADDGELYSVTKESDLYAGGNYDEYTVQMLSTPIISDLKARALAGGSIEVSAALEVSFVTGRICNMQQVVEIARTNEEYFGPGSKSQIILRYPEPNESLWDIAKKYRTTVDSIRHANGLEGDTAAADAMLLIPQK